MEYYAALAPWAVFNVNRGKDVTFMEPLDFMLRRRARAAMTTETPTQPAPTRGRPARLLAPVPPEGRYAIKGERPPSKYSPGERDGVIARYDTYARAFWAKRVRPNGR
jgi:hypothetical protein